MPIFKVRDNRTGEVFEVDSLSRPTDEEIEKQRAARTQASPQNPPEQQQPFRPFAGLSLAGPATAHPEGVDPKQILSQVAQQPRAFVAPEVTVTPPQGAPVGAGISTEQGINILKGATQPRQPLDLALEAIHSGQMTPKTDANGQPVLYGGQPQPVGISGAGFRGADQSNSIWAGFPQAVRGFVQIPEEIKRAQAERGVTGRDYVSAPLVALNRTAQLLFAGGMLTPAGLPWLVGPPLIEGLDPELGELLHKGMAPLQSFVATGDETVAEQNLIELGDAVINLVALVGSHKLKNKIFSGDTKARLNNREVDELRMLMNKSWDDVQKTPLAERVDSPEIAAAVKESIARYRKHGTLQHPDIEGGLSMSLGIPSFDPAKVKDVVDPIIAAYKPRLINMVRSGKISANEYSQRMQEFTRKAVSRFPGFLDIPPQKQKEFLDAIDNYPQKFEPEKKRMTLTHYSHLDDIGKLDPKKQGTGKVGEEGSRPDRMPATFFFTGKGDRSKYKEHRFGPNTSAPHKYVVEGEFAVLDAESPQYRKMVDDIYNAQKKRGVINGEAADKLLERQIVKLGYDGIGSKSEGALKIFRPLDVKVEHGKRVAVRGTRFTDSGERTTDAVHHAMNDFMDKNYGRPIGKDAPVADKAQRFVDVQYNDVMHELRSNYESSQFYNTQFSGAVEKLLPIYPELQNPVAQKLFAAMVAVTSNGTGLSQNLKFALEAFESFARTGRIDLERINGEGWSTRDANVRLSLERINRLIDKHGPEGAAEFLTGRHPSEILSEVSGTTRGVADELGAGQPVHGSYIFGPKIGAFMANLLGETEPVTLDTWAIKNWQRSMGRISDKRWDLTPKARQEVIEGYRKLQAEINNQINPLTGEKYNLTLPEVQAALWENERQIYKEQGVTLKEETYVETAERIARESTEFGELEGRTQSAGGKTPPGEPPSVERGVEENAGEGKKEPVGGQAAADNYATDSRVQADRANKYRDTVAKYAEKDSDYLEELKLASAKADAGESVAKGAAERAARMKEGEEGKPVGSLSDAETRQRLVDKFGETESVKRGGVLLPDGTMIDLGEKKRPDYDMRVYDHEDLVLAGAGDVRFLMDRGAVRLIPEGPGFSVGKPLSGQQKRVLKNWIEDHIIDRNNPHKEISVSISARGISKHKFAASAEEAFAFVDAVFAGQAKAKAYDPVRQAVEHSEHKGSTRNLNGEAPPQDRGFGLSIYPERGKIIEGEKITEAQFKKFASENADLLSKPNHYIGTWVSNGMSYLDVSVTMMDRAKAIEAARAMDQIAVWDTANKKEIGVGGTGVIGEVEGAPEIQGRYEALQKAPPPGKKLFNPPNPETKKISSSYRKKAGIRTPEGKPIETLDVERSKKIADAFDELKSDPKDLETNRAYRAMADETLDQFDEIQGAGYKVEIFTGEGEPYKNSAEMIQDLQRNKHLYIFSTESGFGKEITQAMRDEHPLLEFSGVNDVNGKPLLVNDVFRFVHDFFGHSERGNSFGPLGEENAWDVHARMFSPLARRAMTTETRGQNSWVNFGPQMRNPDGSFKQIPLKDRPFAEQKVGLLPEEFSKIEGEKAPPTVMELTADPTVFWHGTAGDLRGGKTGLHVGTYEAARQALEARIGVPAVGEWDGTRVYGETLLAGKRTLQRKGEYLESGANAGDIPEHDYLPMGRASFSDNSRVPMTAKPVIMPVRVKGKMTRKSSAGDDYANKTMFKRLKVGNKEKGIFYENMGEDVGSVSATVPSVSHLEMVDYTPPVHGRRYMWKRALDETRGRLIEGTKKIQDITNIPGEVAHILAPLAEQVGKDVALLVKDGTVKASDYAMEVNKRITEEMKKHPELVELLKKVPDAAKYAVNINLNRLDVPPEAKTQVTQAMDQLMAAGLKDERKPITFEEITEAAETADPLSKVVSREQAKNYLASLLRSRKILSDASTRPGVSAELIKEAELVSTNVRLIAQLFSSLRIGAGPDGLLPHEGIKGQIITRLREAGVSADELAQAGKDLDWTNPKAVAQFYRKYEKPKFLDDLTIFRYINLLSSPLTHIVNATSNFAQVAGLSPATRLAWGGTDWFAHKLTGRERENYSTSVGPYYKGALNAVPAALNDAWETLLGRRFVERPDIGMLPPTGKSSSPFGVPLAKFNQAFHPILRALEAGDVLFRSIATGGELEAISHNARRSGKAIAPDVAKAQAEARAKYWVFRKALDAGNETGQGAVLSAMDQMTQGIYGLRKVPGVSWFIPFVQTPMNILKQGVEFTPGIGLTTLFKSKHKPEQVAKQIVGSTVFLGAAWAVFEGDATWSLPKDEKERQKWYDQGKQPFSIKINGQWVSFEKLGPISFPIAMAAALKHYTVEQGRQLDKETIDLLGDTMLSSLEFFSNQSYVKGAAEMMDAVRGNERAFKGIVESAPSQLIPLVSLQRWVSRMIDPVFRQTKGVKAGIQAGIPGASQSLLPYRDVFGQESKRDFPLMNSFNPFRVKSDQTVNDPIKKELAMLDYQPSQIGDTINGEKISPEDHERLKVIYGGLLKEIFSEIINDPSWKQMPVDEKMILLDRTADQQKQAARGMLQIEGVLQ